MIWRMVFSATALAAILPNAIRIARAIDNKMMIDRRPNRREEW